MAKELDWQANDYRDGQFAKTDDGYLVGYRKLDGVSTDGYLAQVDAPNWTYTGRFNSIETAKSWCRKTVIQDRRSPLSNRPAPLIAVGAPA